MKSRVNDNFIALYKGLPSDIRTLARKNYRLWLQNHRHPSLHFKVLASFAGIDYYSVRIGLNWRAIGAYDSTSDTITWYWIGSHADYDAIIKGL